MSKPRVAIHINEGGEFSIYSDEGVEVYTVMELTPLDRVYRSDRQPIPDGMISGPIGHSGDEAHARVTEAVQDAFDLPPTQKKARLQ